MRWSMSESEFILEIRNLEKSYIHQNASIFSRKKSVKVLKDISFAIQQGEIFGLVGESGCGKSTLGRSIVGLIQDTLGEILVDGENVKTSKGISSKVQIVFQDPLSSLNPKKKIGWILEEPLKIHKIGNREERRKRVNQILDVIGLDSSYRDRYPHELSGGQRQRISIGSSLMLQPKLIIADEPVSALDVSVQSQILNLMKDLHDKLRLSYLFISHNLNVVYYICDRVAVMYLGRIVELSSVDELYNHPLHPYTKALLSAVPEVDIEKKNDERMLYGEVESAGVMMDGCEFYPRCPNAGEVCRLSSPEMICLKGENGSEHYVRCHCMKE